MCFDILYCGSANSSYGIIAEFIWNRIWDDVDATELGTISISLNIGSNTGDSEGLVAEWFSQTDIILLYNKLLMFISEYIVVRGGLDKGEEAAS